MVSRPGYIPPGQAKQGGMSVVKVSVCRDPSMCNLMTSKVMRGARALGLLVRGAGGSAQARVSTLPAPPFGYVMSQQSSTLLVVDTRTNDIVTKVKHPDLVRPAG